MLMILIFLLSGFDSRSITKRIKFIGFPKSAKPKRLVDFTGGFEPVYTFGFLFIGAIGVALPTWNDANIIPAHVILGLTLAAIFILGSYALIEGIELS